QLVSAGSDGTLRWWNPQNGECLLSRQEQRSSFEGHKCHECTRNQSVKIREIRGRKYNSLLSRATNAKNTHETNS
ncbi:MAG: hypothetical protein WA077_20830, partial [Anaerolineae bacterium]